MIKNTTFSFKEIEKYANENECDIEEIGSNNIGESFIVMRSRNQDEITSFVLSGATSSQYAYECIYTDILIMG